MPKKITGVLINPDDGTAEKKTIEDRSAPCFPF